MQQKSKFKAVFSLKSKILYFDFSDMKLKLKLFDSLIRPIISYVSEIWISDFTQKELKSENLPFEKIHNRLCKYLLGVHKKSSNFASRGELGRLPILSFIRDRPYNLKGFLFRSEFFFRTTQELEYFFLSGKARIFFPEFNVRLYDKNSESDYFFFLHENQNIFFSNIGNQNGIFRKNHNPPPPPPPPPSS